MVQILIEDGQLKDNALVTGIVPSTKNTGFEGATFRHLIDMTTEFKWDENVSASNQTEMFDKINEDISAGGDHSLVAGCEFSPQYDWVNYILRPSVFKWNDYFNINERPGPRNIYEFLTLIQPTGKEHGKKYTYRTVNTDLLAWIVDAVLEDSHGSEHNSSL